MRSSARRLVPLVAACLSACARGAAAQGVAPPVAFVREDGHGIPGMYYGSMAVADFDGDGKPDVVISGNWDTVFDAGRHTDKDGPRLVDRVRVYRNVSERGGPIRFVLAKELSDLSGARGSLVVVGDFDGDRRPDFAVEVRNGDDVASYLNTGKLTFAKHVLEKGFGNHSTSLGMAATDVDRDGRDDLVFISDGGEPNRGLWYRWDAKARRWEAEQRGYPHAIGYGGTIAAGDLDGDGFPEIAVGGNSRAPFGSHRCENLMFGETIRNRGKQGAGFELDPMVVLGTFGLREPPASRRDLRSCHGMDNAGMAIADLDLDGHGDVIIAGSATGFQGPPDRNGQQYDLVVLFNRDGTGRNFTTWENVGPQDSDGTTNGGVGNVDFPNIAVGDLDGDRYPEIFIQGHRRDYGVRWDVDGNGVDKDNPYVFEDKLFHNERGRGFVEVPLARYLPAFDATRKLPRPLGFLADRPRFVGEGGQAIADFDGDGKNDLLFSGAELPFHTNGVNGRDENDASTIATHVLRNVTRTKTATR